MDIGVDYEFFGVVCEEVLEFGLFFCLGFVFGFLYW